MRSRIISIGLIGLGNMGQNHLRVLSMLKDAEVKFVYDTNQKVLNKLAKKYDVKPSINLEKDLETVQAVVIVTPTFTHCNYIELASRYVKNIFVEKPITDTLKTTIQIDKLVKDKGLNLQVGFIERFNPAVVELKKLIEYSSGIVNIDFIRTNKVSSRITDVDVITDLMIHDIDLALYLNGDYKKITAYGTVEDEMIAFARATIYHKNGRFSNITASRITEKRIRQINVTADDMYIDCNLLRKEILINKQSVASDYEDVTLTSIEETINVVPQEALLGEHLSFVRFTRGEGQDVPTECDGLKAMEIVNEIQTQIVGN